MSEEKLYDCQLSQEELAALYQHWYVERHWGDFEAWRDECGINHGEWCREMVANEHMRKIEAILGPEEAEYAHKQAHEYFKQQVGEPAWTVWAKGTDQEQAEFRQHQLRMRQLRMRQLRMRAGEKG